MNNIIYDFYCRKSQEDEDRQVLSLEAQEKECLMFAQKNGIKIRKIWKESYSAKAPGRPIFNQMMQDIADKKVQGILSWHPDRLSRNSVDGGLIIYYLDNGLIQHLVFPTYHYENTPQGKWMLNIQFGQSKYYVDTLSENVKRGNRLKLEKGWRPNMAPAGYLNERVEKTIIPDPERFPILQRAMKEIIDGKLTVLEALHKINKEWGYTSLKFKKRGGEPLSRSAMYRMLTNTFYCGIIKYDGHEYKGKHEAMITENEFNTLQVVLGKKGKPRPQKHAFPLTGQIRCGECGSMITAEIKSKFNKELNVIKTYTYYRCSKKNKSIKCKQPYLLEDKLEKQVDGWLGKITIHKEFQQWALKYIDYANTHEEKIEQATFSTLHKQQESTRGELTNLVRMRAKEQIDDEMFDTEKTRIKKEIKRLEELVTSANKQADDWVELMEETFNYAFYSRVHFANGDFQKKRYIFSKLGSNFQLKDKILSLEIDKRFFAFTEEFQQQEEPLELTKNRYMKLQKEGIAPADPRWLGDMDSNHDKQIQSLLSYH